MLASSHAIVNKTLSPAVGYLKVQRTLSQPTVPFVKTPAQKLLGARFTVRLPQAQASTGSMHHFH